MQDIATHHQHTPTRRQLLSWLLAGAAGPALAHTNAPLTTAASASLDAELAGRIDALVTRMLRDKQAPGAVLAIARHGRPVYRRAFGLADARTGRPMRETTVCEIGSITKQLTAAALLRLSASGHLALDDCVTRYLHCPAAAQVTLAQLLQQTSGLPDYAGTARFADQATRRPTSAEAIVDSIRQMPSEFAPGTRWKYSNTNYLLAGMVVAQVTGQAFDEHLARQLIAPAGMGHTQTVADAPRIADMACGHTTRDGHVVAAPTFQSSWLGGAGNLVSTVDDLLAWDQALWGGQVLAPAELARMQVPAPLNDGSQAGYGMGLFVDSQGGHRRIWHGGGTLGFSASNMLYPDDGLAMVALVNHEDLNASALTAAVFELLHPDAATPLQPAPGEDAETTRLALQWLRQLQQGRLEAASMTPDLAERLHAQQSRLLLALKARVDVYGRPEALVYAGTTPAPDGNGQRYRARFGAQWLSLDLRLTPQRLLDDLAVVPD